MDGIIEVRFNAFYFPQQGNKEEKKKNIGKERKKTKLKCFSEQKF